MFLPHTGLWWLSGTEIHSCRALASLHATRTALCQHAADGTADLQPHHRTGSCNVPQGATRCWVGTERSSLPQSPRSTQGWLIIAHWGSWCTSQASRGQVSAWWYCNQGSGKNITQWIWCGTGTYSWTLVALSSIYEVTVLRPQLPAWDKVTQW